MKYLYFDTSSGFSAVMALGALIDMYMEEGFVNTFLLPFGAKVFTETVNRGCFEGCLAHVDLGNDSGERLGKTDDELLKKIVDEFKELSPESGIRDVFEAICVYKLVESMAVDAVYYGTDLDSGFFDTGEEIGNNTPDMSCCDYALLKLIKARSGMPENGEISLVGYGAGSPVENPEGILRAVLYEENRDGLFMTGRSYEALFSEEIAVI